MDKHDYNNLGKKWQFGKDYAYVDVGESMDLRYTWEI